MKDATMMQGWDMLERALLWVVRLSYAAFSCWLAVALWAAVAS